MSGVLWAPFFPIGVIFIVDWDDTLFPTSWIYKKATRHPFKASKELCEDWFGHWVQAQCKGLEPPEPLMSLEELAALKELDTACSSFLRAALALGHVSAVVVLVVLRLSSEAA